MACGRPATSSAESSFTPGPLEPTGDFVETLILGYGTQGKGCLQKNLGVKLDMTKGLSPLPCMPVGHEVDATGITDELLGHRFYN